MLVARASLRDRNWVNNQGFKFLAHLGDGPDESGLPGYVGGLPDDTQGETTASMVRARGAGGRDKLGAQGYVGGPALDAGRSCVTLGVMGQRICRRARGGAGRSCVTLGP